MTTGGGGELLQGLRQLQGCPPWMPVGGKGALALTKDGTQKTVKDAGELTTMVNTNAP